MREHQRIQTHRFGRMNLIISLN